MKRFDILLATFLVLSGCSTGSKRTLYQQDTGEGGYSGKQIDEKTIVVRFAGNAFTSSIDAQVLSNFRAFELCREQGYQLPDILFVENKTVSKTVHRTSNYSQQNPAFYSGSTDSNSNLYGYIYGGGTHGGSSSWNETYNYPTFDTYFRCTNYAFVTGVGLRKITADEMKPFVKDLMGAVQVTIMSEVSPNKGILEIGDFIIRINGHRINSESEFLAVIDGSENKNNVNFELVRNAQTIKVIGKATDETLTFTKAFEKLLTQVCTTVPEIQERPICASAKRIPATNKEAQGKPSGTTVK